MKKVICAAVSILIMSNAFASADGYAKAIGDEINAGQQAIVGGSYQVDIYNPNSFLNETYIIDESVCIDNGNCTKVHKEYTLKPLHYLYLNDAQQLKQVMPNAGVYEVEATLAISGYEHFNIKGIDQLIVS